MLNRDVIQKWAENLEGGRYEQGTGGLRKGDTYCCLGVLCDMYAQQFDREWELLEYYDSRNPYMYAFLGHEDYLPVAVRQWAGIDDNNPVFEGNTLSGMNDGRSCEQKSFIEIAQMIRKKYLDDNT